MRNDVIGIARGSVDAGFHDLPEHARTAILAELSRAVFGTADEPGIASTLRSIKFWGTLGGGAGLVLQIIQTLQLQDPIKRAVVALFTGGAHGI